MAEPTPSAEEVRDLVTAVVAAVGSDRNPAALPDGMERRGPADEGESVVPARAGTALLADIAVGGDHGGFLLKQRIAVDLREHGFTVHDCGTESEESVDYPDYAHAVAAVVARGDCRWGIVVDGAGIGSAITANKVPGIRAATCWDVSSAKNSREHNHANVLALGAGLIGENLALQIVQTWLSTGWGGGRHAGRVAKIAEIEARYRKEGAA